MKTQITNTSGAALYRGYLPPHGRSLGIGESLVVDGDLRSQLASGRGRYNRATELAALDADCAAGDVNLAEVAEDCSSSS